MKRSLNTSAELITDRTLSRKRKEEKSTGNDPCLFLSCWWGKINGPQRAACRWWRDGLSLFSESHVVTPGLLGEERKTTGPTPWVVVLLVCCQLNNPHPESNICASACTDTTRDKRAPRPWLLEGWEVTPLHRCPAWPNYRTCFYYRNAVLYPLSFHVVNLYSVSTLCQALC